MTEHRMIERMLSIMQDALWNIESRQKIDPSLVDRIIDFIVVYVDETHHGKEEDIFFKHLKDKPLSPEDSGMMEELIEEHVFGRETTTALSTANNLYRNGDESSLADLAEAMKALIEFYPRHIDKEDNRFFPASRTYMTNEEEQSMLAQFRDYDQNMIHRKYRSVLEKLEQAR